MARRSRCVAAGAGGTGAVSAGDHLARLSGQPLPDEPPRREPREQGVRHRVDRSQGQHLRRSEGVRQHALQPPVRSAVRPERDRRVSASPAPAASSPASSMPTRTGIVGYSMGGYGVVNVIGGGYSAASATVRRCAAEQAARRARRRQSRLPEAPIDPRIKAAIAIGPWGMQGGFWDAEGLKGIRTPVLFVAGSVDDDVGIRERHAGDLSGRGQRRSVSPDVRQRQPQRRGADSGAGRRPMRHSERDAVVAVRALCGRRVGHRADEQHPRSLRDRLLRPAPQGRAATSRRISISFPTARTRCMPSIARASRRPRTPTGRASSAPPRSA